MTRRRSSGASCASRGSTPTPGCCSPGSPAEIDVVTRRYEVTVRRAAAAITHDCLAFLIDPAGQLRGRYGPPDLPKPAS